MNYFLDMNDIKILRKDFNKFDLIKNGAFLRSKLDLELYNKFSSERYGDPHLNRLKLLEKIQVKNKIKIPSF